MSLKSAIKSKNVKEIRKIALSTPEAEVADLIESLTPAERVVFFRLLKSKQQSKIFMSLEQDYQEQIIKLFTDEELKGVVSYLYADEIADLIEEVPSDISQRILSNTPKERREDVNKILRYDDDQVGSIMTVDILTLKTTWTVSKAIKFIKENREDAYIGHYFFIVNAKGALVGSITVEDLLFNANTKKLKDISTPTGYTTTTSSLEEAAIAFADYDRSVLPVTNTNGTVVGVITADDMIDVIQEEATEDFEKMAGISSSDEVPYSRTKTKSLFKSRILWLMLLMISATLSQIVLDAFQNISQGVFTAVWVTTAIVAILPVISGAAGNAGSQSSTMVIRSLAIGDIETKDYRKVMWKEIKVSTLIGLTLGIANFARLMIYYSVSGDIDNEHLFLSFAASLALWIVIILAKVVGGTLPLLAKKLKLDPAVMAAPLLTTLIDAVSTMIFFGISVGIMKLVI